MPDPISLLQPGLSTASAPASSVDRSNAAEHADRTAAGLAADLVAAAQAAGLEAARTASDDAQRAEDEFSAQAQPAALTLPSQAQLNRADAAALAARFADAAAAYPANLAPQTSDQTMLADREAAAVNRALRAVLSGADEDLAAAEASPSRSPLHTAAGKRLRADLDTLVRAADQKGASAQALGAIYLAGRIQTSGSDFTPKAQAVIANDLFEGVVRLLAAEEPKDAEDAKQMIRSAFEKLDQLSPQGVSSDAANEVRAVLGETTDALAAAKEKSLSAMAQVRTAADDSADIRAGEFGLAPDEVGRITTGVHKDLRAFGGVMTPLRDSAAGALLNLSKTVDQAQTVIESADSKSIRAACAELAAVRELNPAAARALDPQAQSIAQKVVLGELALLFAVDSSGFSASAGRPEDVLGGRIDWQSIDQSDSKTAALFEHIDAVLSEVRPQGLSPLDASADESLLEALLPYQQARESALVRLLGDSPMIAQGFKAEASALLLGPETNALERALATDKALAKLQEGLAETLAARDPQPAADELLSRFGIDETHPLGGMNGGLRGLAGKLAFGMFAPQTTSDGLIREPAYRPQVLQAAADKIAQGLAADHRAFAQALRAEAQIFADASSGAEAKHRSFAAVLQLLSVMGALKDSLSSILPDAGPGASAQTREAALCEILRSADPAAHGADLLKAAAAAEDPQLTAAAGLYAAAIEGVLAKTAPQGSAARQITAVRLGAEYLDALSLNDFYVRILHPTAGAGSGAPHLAVDALHTRPDSALGKLMQGAQAFRANVGHRELLGLLGTLAQTNAKAVQAELLALAADQASADPARAEAYYQDAQRLASQYEVLSRHADVLFYGAHALYGAENPGIDPWDLRPDTAANRAFLAELESAGIPNDLAARLMRDGVRGAHRAAASKAALASLKASAALFTRNELAAGFGIESEVNAARALRWYLTKIDPQEKYIADMNVETLAQQFRAAAAADPGIERLGLDASQAVQEAQAMQLERLTALEERLGITNEAVSRIKNGIRAAQGVSSPKALAKMQGQTAGMALYVLNAVLLNSPEDFSSENLRHWIGHLADPGTLTEEDLAAGMRRAAATPLADRECAVMLHALMKHETAAGRPADLTSIFSRFAPQEPSAETLAGLSDQARADVVALYQSEAAKYADECALVRAAYEAHAASDADAAAGRASLAVADNAAAAKLMTALQSKALDDTIAAGEKHTEQTVREAYSALTAKLAAPGSTAQEIIIAKRELGAALSGRMDRGRAVLLTKVHDLSKPSGTAEFENAWKKLELKSTDESLRKRLSRASAGKFGELTRLALTASQRLSAESAKQYLLKTADENTLLALQTAAHCAVESAASSLGTTADKLLAKHRHWEGTAAAADIQCDPAAHPGVQQLIDNAGSAGSIALSELLHAFLAELLPPAAADAYMSAMMKDNGAAAAKTSTSLLFRSERLRKAKYFHGIAEDIRQAYAGDVKFAQLRGKRTELFSERMRGLYADCLSSLSPGASIAIDKTGRVTLLGAEKKWSRETQSAGADTKESRSAELSAKIDVNLTDGLLIRKELDGTVTVRVAKGAGVGASASAKAEAGIRREFEGTALNAELSAGMSAQASAGIAVGGTFGAQRSFSVKDAAFFLDRLLRGKTEAADLNAASLSVSIHTEANFSAGISAALALGFETAEKEETLEPVALSADAGGSTTEITESTDSDGSTKRIVTVENADGSALKTTTVTDAHGRVTSRTAESTDKDGNVLRQAVERGTSLPFTGGLEDQAEKLSICCQAGLSLDGSISGRRTVRQTPTVRETEWAFSGSISLKASASVEQEGLSALADLAGESLELEKTAEASWNIETTYTITSGAAADKITAVSKEITCRIMGPEEENQANIEQVKNLVAAQGLPQAASDALAHLLLTADLEPSAVTFQSTMTQAARETLGTSELADIRTTTKRENYELSRITLNFSEETANTKLLSRIVNQASSMVGGAVELSSAVVRGNAVTIDVEALTRVTPEAIKASLSQRQS